MTVNELRLIELVLIEYSKVRREESVFKALDLIQREIHIKRMDPRK